MAICAYFTSPGGDSEEDEEEEEEEKRTTHPDTHEDAHSWEAEPGEARPSGDIFSADVDVASLIMADMRVREEEDDEPVRGRGGSRDR